MPTAHTHLTDPVTGKRPHRYGVPYKGSKNAIAEWVVSRLPPADTFVDLFAGGCAVTHAAMLSGKYRHFIANDLDWRGPRLFADAIAGKYADETRWISREDFFRLKDADPYVALCWSFGNDAKTYMYGRRVEQWKKALHYARVLGDTSLLRAMGLPAGDGGCAWCREHEAEIRETYARFMAEDVAAARGGGKADAACSLGAQGGLENLQRLQSLQRLQGLQSLRGLQRLQRPTLYMADYREVPLPPDAVVYCDIPYKGTSQYSVPFAHAEFCEWARVQTVPLFVSEYDMPASDFVCVGEKARCGTLSATNNAQRVTERLYRPRAQMAQTANY